MRPGLEMDRHDPFEQLRSELAAIEPSAGFGAGVQQGLAVRPVRSVGFWMTAAAAATVVVAAGVVSWRAWTDVPPVRLPGPAVDVAPYSPSSNAVGPRATAPAVARIRPSRPVTTVQTEPRLEVLVPPDEAIAVRYLLLAQRRGRGVVPPALSLEASTALLPDITAIKIEPLQIPPIGGEGKDK